MQERVQRLLLSVLGQAAEPARARPRVHAARLALFERASHAAPAAGLLHRLAAHGHRRAHGQHLLIARLARHVGRAAAGDAQQRNQQEGEEHRHGGCGSRVKLRGVEWAVGGDEYQLSVAENPFFVAGLSPNIRRVRVASTGASARSLVSVSASDARVLSHSAVLLKTPQSYQELKKRVKQTNEIIQTPRKSPLSDARFRLRAGCSSSNEKRKKKKAC